MTQPFPSWTYNEETSDWEAPVPRPDLTDDDKVNRKMYRWIELPPPTGGGLWELTVVPDNIDYPHSV